MTLVIGQIAAIYDLHGNLPALEAVLQDVRRAGVDRIVVGGDVLPGPMPRETLACLLDLDIPVQFIQGNGEREVLALMSGTETGAVPEQVREVMRWNAAQLRPEDKQLLASWPTPFGEPGAYWLLLGPNVQLRHTSYDLTKAAERIQATSYPQAQDFAAKNILQPPSEEETLEAFAKVELR